MQHIQRPAPFVLVSSNHGTMIVSRNDYNEVEVSPGQLGAYGVGYQLLTSSAYDQPEVDLALTLLDRRLNYYGPGVVAIDCGANIGVHTIEWGKFLAGRGEVRAFEAQEKIFYALAGNIVVNNCLNVSAKHCAVGASCSTIDIPEPDYLVPSSYGSFELKQKPNTENIGQFIDYNKTKTVDLISIDSLNLDRLDLLKIDVEGMEEEVLAGAANTISKLKPMMLIEHIKSDREALEKFCSANGYNMWYVGMNILAIHTTDRTSVTVNSNNTFNIK